MSSKTSPIKTVVVLRFGAAGDVLVCAPAITALKNAWPEANIIFVTHMRHAPLVRGWPEIGDVVALHGQSLFALVRQLRAHRPNAVLDLHASLRSRIIVTLLGVRRRAVWQKRSWTAFFAVRWGHAPYRPKSRQSARYHSAVERLVGRPLKEAVLRHVPTCEAQQEGRRAFLSLGPTSQKRPLVILHPGANWATKRYPVAHYQKVAQALHAEGLDVLALGSPKEAALLLAIQQGAPNLLLLDRPLSLAGLAGILPYAQAFVVGDTGPMHLARGLGIPCVVIFGSTPKSAFDLAGHLSFSSTLGCAPCSFYGRAQCPRGHLDCLVALAPDAVVRAVLDLVSRYGQLGSSSGRVATLG